MDNKGKEGVPLDQLEVGQAYEIDSRNLRVGIWDGHSFHGIRTKFDDKFIDHEVHYDLDPHFGTAVAIRKLA